MSRRFAAAFILFDVKKRNLPMRLIFIRHGDPDYAIDSLTEKGWKVDLKRYQWKNTLEEAEAFREEFQKRGI